MGADIPQAANYVAALQPLLSRFGNETNLTIILFTLDESTYSRELGAACRPLSVSPSGTAWWFHDSPEGMMRYREQVTETAGLLQHGRFQ